MTESGELNTCDMWQDLLQGVKGNFQVIRALAAAEQKHLGAHSPEVLQLITHIDDELKVIVQRWSECPHHCYFANRNSKPMPSGDISPFANLLWDTMASMASLV